MLWRKSHYLSDYGGDNGMEIKMSPKRSKKETKVSKSTQFAYAEIYRQLRTNIEFSSFEKKIHVVNTVSTNPAEGKSSVASNLATVAVAKYSSVLLIDCDLRKPVQHKIFKVSNKVGLSNLMHDMDDFDVNDDKYFQKFKDNSSDGKLYLLTSGVKVPNPQELLASEKFKTLIEKLKTRFDFIIIDCPPISAVADAVHVGHVCDGSLFVISAKNTNKNEAKLALTELQRSGVNVLGSVLTMTEATSKHYYNYYSDL